MSLNVKDDKSIHQHPNKIKFYTPKEVGEILKLNYRLILKLIIVGSLPAFQIGKQYRISEFDLMEYLKSKKY
jgi:excisionase family DNA binding protein